MSEPSPNNEPDAIVSAICCVSSFLWGTSVAFLMYANTLYLIAVIAIYCSIFLASRSIKVKHGAAWSLFGVAFWYVFYWCVMFGGEFH